MNKKSLKAIIFDYDGTLVNSEFLWLKIHIRAFRDFGFCLSNQQALEMRSAGNPLIYSLVYKWFGIKKEQFIQIDKHARHLFKKDKYYFTGMLKPYVIKTLKVLKEKGYKIAISSGEKEKEIIRNLKRNKILEYFDFISSTEKVLYGKPKPDVYLHCCNKLKLPPAECLVIEDSPNGVISACRAECKVIMIPDLTKPDKKLLETFNFITLRNLNDLLKYLKKEDN